MSRAIPIASMPVVDIKQQWLVKLDHTFIVSSSVLNGSHPPKDSYVLFRFEKNEPEPLMTSSAHYYGDVAYGFIVQDDASNSNSSEYFRVKDILHDTQNARRMQVLLTTKTGTNLPEQSPELYPSGGATLLYAINLPTYRNITPGDWVYLLPDPDRIDITKTPPESWIYTQVKWPIHTNIIEPGALKFCVHRKRTNVAIKSGRHVRYALEGSILKHKYVASPLSREVGLHLAPGPASQEKIGRSYSSERMHVTTNMSVVENHDFKIGDTAIHVAQKTAKGFYGYKLLLDDIPVK